MPCYELGLSGRAEAENRRSFAAWNVGTFQMTFEGPDLAAFFVARNK
jgi:hypothetical protein